MSLTAFMRWYGGRFAELLRSRSCESRQVNLEKGLLARYADAKRESVVAGTPVYVDPVPSACPESVVGNRGEGTDDRPVETE